MTESEKKQIRVLLRAQAVTHARKAEWRRRSDAKHSNPKTQTADPKGSVMRRSGPKPGHP